MVCTKLLFDNGLIVGEPIFVLPSGFIGILFCAPTVEFKKYIEENVK